VEEYDMVVIEEMKQRRLGMQNKAVARTIETLLMVVLDSIVLSVIQLVYIPEVMEQRESEHMELVLIKSRGQGWIP